MSSEFIDQVIAAYLEAEASGQPPDREALLTRHPDLADELRSFFFDHDRMHALAQPLVGPAPSEAATLGAEAPALAPGTAVRYFGDYEVLGELGRGGMGVVYKARQVSLSRIVALKMVLDGQLASEADLRRFQTEAEAAANLDHPNIVPVHEVGEHHGQHYYSMKFVEAGSLACPDGRWRGDPRTAVRLLVKVARAVHHAHQRGILHRDLKPANVLLDDKSEPYVADFGLARRMDAPGATHSGAIVGTPAYMSPEQARGEKALTTAADVYSLGAILFELLTGRPPFQAASAMDVLLQVLQHDPPRPRTVNPGLDHDLETICLKCLNKEPAKRYPSAAALVDDLERWLAGEPIQARPAGPWERTVKWARRRPASAALVAVTVSAVVFIVALCWGAYQGRLRAAQESAQREEQHGRAVEKERDATRRAYRRSEGMRLTSQSELLRPYDPGLALLLAVEGAERHPGHLANRALLRALEDYRELGTFGDPETPLQDVIFSPDGRWALAAGDGALYVWEVATGKEANALRAPGKWLAARFSSDGRRAIAVGDQAVRTWDVGTAEALAVLPGPDKFTLQEAGLADDNKFASLSPDGRVVVLGFGNPRLCDAKSGREVTPLKGHQGRARSARFSPDGRHVVTTAMDGTARLWETDTGKQVRSWEQPGAFDAVFSPDGHRVLTVGRGAHVWDIATGKQLASTEVAKDLHPFLMGGQFVGDRVLVSTSVSRWRVVEAAGARESCSLPLTGPQPRALSPDGQRLAAVQDDGLRLFDLHTGSEVLVIRARHLRTVSAVAFHPDGRRVITAGRDGARLWDVQTGPEHERARGHWVGLRYAVPSPDGSRLVTGADWNKPPQVWEIATGRELFRLAFAPGEELAGASAVRFSPDGTRIIRIGTGAVIVDSQPQRCTIWDARTGRPEVVLQGDHHAVCWADFSLDGRRIITTDFGTAWLWDAISGRELAHWALNENGNPVRARFLDEDRVLTDSAHLPALGLVLADVAPKVRDARTGRVLFTICPTLTGHPLPGPAVPGRRAGRALSFDPSTPTYVWGLATGKELFRLKNMEIPEGVDGHNELDETADADLSADESVAITAAHAEVNVWDLNTGKKLRSLRGHEGDVKTCRFSPDGRWIVTAAEDRTVRLWDVGSGAELVRYEADGAPENAEVTADGRLVLATFRKSKSDQLTAHFWPSDPLPTVRAALRRGLTARERKDFDINP